MSAQARSNDTAHAIGTWVAAIIAAQGPVSQYIISLPIPARIANLAVSAFALAVVIYSKRIDSTHDATVKVAGVVSDTAPVLVDGGQAHETPTAPPPAPPGVIA